MKRGPFPAPLGYHEQCGSQGVSLGIIVVIQSTSTADFLFSSALIQDNERFSSALIRDNDGLISSSTLTDEAGSSTVSVQQRLSVLHFFSSA